MDEILYNLFNEEVVIMIKIAVVEDEKEERNRIQKFLQKFSCENSVEMEIEEFSDGIQLVQEYERNFDVLLLDIEMEKLNGIQTAKEIRKKDKDVMILFITNLFQYAIEGYEVEAIDFVIKPINYFSFSARMEKVLKKLEQKVRRLVPFQVRKEMVMLNAHDIILVETSNKKTLIKTEGETVNCSEPMQEIQSKLEPFGFYRCHSGFLINMNYIKRLNSETVLVANFEVPVSKHRKKDFYQAVAAYQGMRL